MVYVGMDVHRKRTQVAVIDDRGEQLLNRNVANNSPELAEGSYDLRNPTTRRNR
jgi:hypothetical protein